MAKTILLAIIAILTGAIFYSYLPYWPDFKFIVIYIAHMINAINPCILIVERFLGYKAKNAKSKRLYRVLRYQEENSFLLIIVFLLSVCLISFYELFPTYLVIGFLSFQIYWTINLVTIK